MAMRFDTSQSMRLGQHMKLAPHMIQSMEILQMSMAELEERIEQELESNATLEVTEPGDPEAALLSRDDGLFGRGTDETRPMEMGSGNNSDDFERLESYAELNPDAAENEFESGPASEHLDRPERSDRYDEPYERSSSGDGEVDAKSEAMANTAARDATPVEQLAEQWMMADVSAELKPLGDLLITYIEQDGYIRTSLETIADKAVPGSGFAGPKPTVEQLDRAIKAMQLLLEPPGVAARSVKECLLLQIDARQADWSASQGNSRTHAADAEASEPNWDLLRKLVENHLEDLGQNRLPKVAARCNVELDELHIAIGVLRTLSLAPGRQLIRTSEPGIVPDAYVEYDADGDRYIAYLNDRSLPNLRVNQEYAKLASERGTDKTTKTFLKTNLSNAQFLIEAIEQRKRTLLRVVQAVVAAQREFFDFGPQALRPLPMTKVADQLGIHVATVSRAVAEKHLSTPRGIVALRKFFSGGTTDAEGQEVSWDAIKAALLDIVENEDKKNPLSDDELVEELKKRGLEIARRTVAKYRSQLEIPTGRLRKQHS
jgi:RNA polymerase sigma-54 factor